MLIVLNKPYGVLCQFSRDGSGKPTLADFVDVPKVYPAGRLDTDSEGLLLLTDHGPLQARITEPRFKLPKAYWVQVEGIPSAAASERLRAGVELRDGVTLPAQVRSIEPPALWPRGKEIRFRKNSPTAWLELVISEGRNRQVRRMTAAVGFPTLRLVRARVGDFELETLAPGQWREVSRDVWESLLVPKEGLTEVRSPERSTERGAGRIRAGRQTSSRADGVRGRRRAGGSRSSTAKRGQSVKPKRGG